MEIITVECPKCKGELYAKEGTEKFFCMYCRNEVIVKQPSLEQPEIVRDSVNHTFQSKLAIAKHNEILYWSGQLWYDQVMESYDEVQVVGAHHWEYWHARASFLVKAGLEEAKRERLFVLASKKAFIDTYTLWMDSAIQHAGENAGELEIEKEKMLNIIEIELEAIQERIPDSSDPLVLKLKLETENYDGLAFIVAIIFIGLLIIASLAS